MKIIVTKNNFEFFLKCSKNILVQSHVVTYWLYIAILQNSRFLLIMC